MVVFCTKPLVSTEILVYIYSFIHSFVISRKSNTERSKKMGEVKHLLLAKFKDEVSQEQIDQLIKGYANLVNHVEPMKSFRWGTDVSVENLHQGFTHVFESTFENTEGIATYISHPVHVEFANRFLAQLDKVLVVDYKPTVVEP